VRKIFKFISTIAGNFSRDEIITLAAALAFFAVLSLAPLLLILVSVTALIGADVQQRIVQQVEEIAGTQVSGIIETIIQNARGQRQTGLISTIIGIATSLFSGAAVFAQLRASLNKIWGVQPKDVPAVHGWIKERLISIAMVLGAALLLLAALIASAAVNMIFGRAGSFVPILNYAVSFAVLTAAFAVMFKFVPSIQVPWRDIWLGAITTGILFMLGRYGIGLYIQHSSSGSVYGAAGSLIILLLWIYYSSIILFLGAEITQEYSCEFGSRVEPAATAEWTEGAREDQCPPKPEDKDES
jgi:membrane protein